MELSATELKWLTSAIDMCQDATHQQWRVGAVIIKSGRVLATGVNRYRNCPSKVDLEGVSYHAEEVALRRAGDVRGATIYVGRTTRSGKIGLAKPCRRCQLMLVEKGIYTAIWTEPRGWGKSRIAHLLEEELSNVRNGTERPAEIHPLVRK